MRDGLHGPFSRLGHVALDMFGAEGCVRAALRRACPRRLRRARVARSLCVVLRRAWPRRRFRRRRGLQRGLQCGFAPLSIKSWRIDGNLILN